MDIQSTAEIIKWIINGITIVLLIAAVSSAIKRKNNLAFAVVLLGNLIIYFLTQSPLLCWIISIAVLIWVNSTKNNEHSSDSYKQPLKSSNSLVKNKRMVKPGVIIGLIFGIMFMVFPIIGFVTHEAFLSDSQGQIIGIGFIIFGAIMFIVNVICLIKGTDNLFASSTDSSSPAPVTTQKVVSKERSDMEKDLDKDSSAKKIRYRFCKKLYSSEYNGCPHCKKK